MKKSKNWKNRSRNQAVALDLRVAVIKFAAEQWDQAWSWLWQWTKKR